ncbi:MAG: hypothetical protein HYX78_15320 [Armatimonadetes bacterium]|nr:hypothetical protein [Armatimonadota bacterium]
MRTAYTPGLKVSQRTTIRKTRRLPLKGQVLAAVGQQVEPDTVVARTEIPGIMQTVRAAEILGIEPGELLQALKVQVGDTVERDQTLAETRSFFGLFKSDCRSPVAGKVELISEHSGHVGIRLPAAPVEVSAYINGTVVEVIPDEGVVIETTGALIQGIFGVGGERTGTIQVLTAGPEDSLTEEMITSDLCGKIVVGGSSISGAALEKAAEIGVAGIIVGAVVDRDLIDFLGYDIGVAITGQEDINTTLIVTEGFGSIRMADRTFRLLKSLEGSAASLNGATQIRAGVIRPELIVPSTISAGDDDLEDPEQVLEIGAHIRAIRAPYFGMLGTVTALPAEPMVIPSGSTVRVLEADLSDGSRVIIPRANVEIIVG